ncbi:MAG: MBL fold metallo-hydrolase [Bacteroidales bacterium]|nr:MBL fold metallo-hydrolase [Bacteroidales bacterium]
MIKCFSFNLLGTNCYVVSDGNSGRCAITDPGCYSQQEREQLEKYIEDNSLTPVAVLLTHCHFDHSLGVEWCLKRWNIPLYMSAADREQIAFNIQACPQFGYRYEWSHQDFTPVSDGQTIEIGDLKIKVLATPGHTKGGVCYLIESEGVVLSGDTLFRDSIGRTDLLGGDLDKLRASISEKLLTLPGDYDVLPGHGPVTSIAYEQNNPFLYGFH